VHKARYFLRRFLYSAVYKWRMGLEDKTRIDVETGHNMALSLDRNLKLQGWVIVGQKRAYGEIDTSAFRKFKNLVHVLRKACRIGDNRIQLEGYKTYVNKSQRFPEEDFDMCQQAFEMTEARQDFKDFISGLEPNEFRDIFAESNIESSIKSFNTRMDLNFCKSADIFLNKLMCWTQARKSPGSDLFFEKVHYLRIELLREQYLRNPGGLSDDDWEYYKKMDPVLDFKLNYSAKHVMVNQVNCCITGPSGKHRDASILYWLDENVFSWTLHPIRSARMSVLDPFGLAIFVKAKGRHFSSQKEEDYLVFEGFPANQEHYWRLKKLGVSLPRLVYDCGLWLARELKISKMFINASHSNNTQQSVDDTVREMISIAEHQESWSDKEGLISDPLTKDVLASLEIGNKQFVYTHFLRKPCLDINLVGKLRRRDNWLGESVFDTWYDWNKFIMDTYDSWLPESKALHPYAESVAKRGKDPQWNLGVGYCNGFEVDVKTEYKRLHNSW